MKFVSAAALLLLGANATKVKSRAEECPYKNCTGKAIDECSSYCKEGYYYTFCYYDCESKTNPMDYYTPSPQCPKLCEDHGIDCPQPETSATSPAHEAASQIMEQFDKNGDGVIKKWEIKKVCK